MGAEQNYYISLDRTKDGERIEFVNDAEKSSGYWQGVGQDPSEYNFYAANNQHTYTAKIKALPETRAEITDAAGEFLGSIMQLSAGRSTRIEIRYSTGGHLMAGPIELFPGLRCVLSDANGPRAELYCRFWDLLWNRFLKRPQLRIRMLYRHGEGEHHLVFAAALIFLKRHAS
jgi:hypothetical protein